MTDRALGPVVLVGASPFGSRALVRLDIPYILVVDPAEDPTPAASHAREVYQMSYRDDADALFDLPRPADVRAVVSFTEPGLLPAARLAELWSTGGVSVIATARSRNKLLMRESLAAGGSTINYGPLHDMTDIGDAHYPIVVKPVSGAAGSGVQLIQGPGDMVAALNLATVPMMWEEYIVGSEYSVETVTVGGHHLVLGITQKSTTGPPYFVEDGHITPAPLSPEDRVLVVAGVCACLDAIGLSVGPAHTEIVLSPVGVQIIETHTRPGGGRIPLITELVTGLDQYELALRAFLGLPIPELSVPTSVAGVKFLSSPPGLLERITGVDRAEGWPGVVEIAFEVTPGHLIRSWKDNLDRAGFIVCVGSTLREVKGLLERVNKAIQFHVNDRASSAK